QEALPEQGDGQLMRDGAFDTARFERTGGDPVDRHRDDLDRAAGALGHGARRGQSDAGALGVGGGEGDDRGARVDQEMDPGAVDLRVEIEMAVRRARDFAAGEAVAGWRRGYGGQG